MWDKNRELNSGVWGWRRKKRKKPRNIDDRAARIAKHCSGCRGWAGGFRPRGGDPAPGARGEVFREFFPAAEVRTDVRDV